MRFGVYSDEGRFQASSDSQTQKTEVIPNIDKKYKLVQKPLILNTRPFPLPSFISTLIFMGLIVKISVEIEV